MIFYLLNEGRMAETEKDLFLQGLSQFTESLDYVISNESIDIIKHTAPEEYDFSDLIGIIEYETDEEIDSLISELQAANVNEG